MTAPLNLIQFCLGAVVLIPLLASALSVLLGTAARRILGVITSAVVLGLSVPILVHVTAGETLELALGGFEPPLGITLRADGLSALFLAMTAVVGAVVSCYAAARPASTGTRLTPEISAASETSETSKSHVRGGSREGVTGGASGGASGGGSGGGRPTGRHRARHRARHAGRPGGHAGFWPLWLGCWSGLNAVFLSGDLFNTYVGLELVGLTAVALVALGGRDAWPAALRYLFIAVLGSLLYLIGVALIYSVTGTLDILGSGEIIAQLAAAQDSDLSAVVLALCLISLGLALKVALVPLHRWLIPAHSSAPSAVSPLLSALVIKASLFVLLRAWLWVAGPLQQLQVLAWVLAGMGAAAILVGSVMALRQSRLKPLIAYSTVAQVGYWFLLLPLLLDPGTSSLEGRPGTALEEGAVLAGALGGTVALALGHGLGKASLFLSAGHLKDLYGTDEFADLRGAGRAHPMLVMSMGLSAVGLIGLPLSLGFSGKWLLATSAVAAGHYWMLVVLVAGTLFSAAYLLKAVAPLLVMSEDDQTALTLPQAQTHPEDPSLTGKAQLAPFVLGLLTVLTGFLGVWLAAVLEVGAPW